MPPTHVALLTAFERLPGRCRAGAMNHYISAVERAVDDFLRQRERGCGMDLRVAVALLPDGRCLLEVELRPAPADRELVAQLRRRVEMLERPPVRGPVAFLLHSLIWGGSDNLADSFRQRHAPQFRNEYPAEFAAAEAAYAAAQPRASAWRRLKAVVKRRALALYRTFVPVPPPDRRRIDAVPPEDAPWRS